MNLPLFVGLSTEQWEDVIDFIHYSIQSDLATDEDHLSGLQIIESIKHQTYQESDT